MLKRVEVLASLSRRTMRSRALCSAPEGTCAQLMRRPSRVLHEHWLQGSRWIAALSPIDLLLGLDGVRPRIELHVAVVEVMPSERNDSITVQSDQLSRVYEHVQVRRMPRAGQCACIVCDRVSPDAAMGLGAAVETRQRRGCLERWIDGDSGGTGEASADKSEGREEGVKEGREEKREGAVLLCFDEATRGESAYAPYPIGEPPFPEGVLPPLTL